MISGDKAPGAGPTPCRIRLGAMPARIHAETWYETYQMDWIGVKPKLRVYSGAPPFETQKTLAVRAIVLDTIDNVHENSGAAARASFGMNGGAVRFHHREGYNILYGDCHATWHGDPQKRIAYAHGGGHNGYIRGTFTMSNCCYPNLTAPNASRLSADADSQGFQGAQQVWTLFDRAAGIDIPQRARDAGPLRAQGANRLSAWVLQPLRPDD